MQHYRNNFRWLLWFAPFRTLAISGAYLVPFFQLHHLSSTDFFMVQLVFSLTVVAWEVPSGYLADRFGRAQCIKLSAPIAAASMIAYGLSSELWQFLLCEITLGVANGLISGADSSLLYDSLHATGDHARFEKATKYINALGFVAPVIGFPIAIWLVARFGFGSTIVCDGVAAALGIPFAWLLAEAPIIKEANKPKTFRQALGTIREMLSHFHVRWLIALTVALGTATYMGAWLSAQTYQQLGIPVALFAAIFAGRQLWKTAWSTFYHPGNHVRAHMVTYTGLVAAGFAGMASGVWLGAPLMLGLDVVHAQQAPALLARLNHFMPGMQRATLNSVVNMLQRLSMGFTGLVAGMLADVSLTLSLVVVGGACTVVAWLALSRVAPHLSSTIT